MVRQKNGTKKIKDKRTADADMGFGEWGGYMEAKRAKLMDQFHETNIEKISNIFQGIAIHVNGLTKPPIEVLKNLMAAHGGLFHSYQVSSTTHIIASNLANVKIKHLGPVPIIKPSWITDSVELGKLLDYKRYVLYTNQSLSQPKLEFPLVNKPSSTVDSNITRELTLIKKDMINDTGENLKLVSSREDEKQGENLSQSMTNNLKHSVASTDQSDDFEKSFFISNLGGSSSVVNNKLIQNQNENKKEGNLEGLPITAEELYTIHSTHEKDIEEYKTSEKNLLFKARASTKTAADPSFLGEFYSNSRLHLISTLGAEFKQLVNDLRERSNGNFPAKEKLLLAGKRTCGSISGSVIMHIDMDCFFVSVSLRNHSELHGKPVAIAHARYAEIANIKPEQKANREQEFALYGERLPVGVTSRVDKIDVLSSLSEIASCSYEARKYGIRNGMFLGQAIKMCPDLKTLPYDFEGYKEVSQALYNIVASYTLDIEAVSCDEMYVDITQILKETGLTINEWADHIRTEIITATKCPCSTGFGSNRLQARLATRKAKPNGKFYLNPEDVESYMATIELADLPGVGRATMTKLRNLGLHTCRDIQQISLQILQKEIGQKAGETLKEQAKGIDRKPLNYYHERKSVSAEVNYGIRFNSLDECHTFLQSLSDEVHKRLSDINMKARCVTLKLLIRSADAPLETAKFLGHGICDSVSKSSTNIVINSSQDIYKEVIALYNKVNPYFRDLRGIGIQLNKLEKNHPKNSAIRNFLIHPPNKKSAIKNSTLDNNTTIEEISSTLFKCSSSFIDPGEGTSKGFGKLINNSLTKKTNIIQTASIADSKGPFLKIDIDHDVLKELPENLRSEVIAEYQLNKYKEIDEIKIDEEINTKPKESDRRDSPFNGLNWEQMKLLIKKWTDSLVNPGEMDAILMGQYFKTYVINRKLELIFTICNSLHRIFTNLSCDWHKAYFIMINIIQEGMVEVYGNTLSVKRSFHCCHV